MFALNAMHQLTGSLLCKRCRKSTKEVKNMQRNVRNPSTGLYLRLQDTKTTRDGDRETERAKNPKCGPPELSAASQRCRMLWGNSTLDSRVGLSTCFVSERIFRRPVIFLGHPGSAPQRRRLPPAPATRIGPQGAVPPAPLGHSRLGPTHGCRLLMPSRRPCRDTAAPPPPEGG